ncbi:MAG: LysM domain-containing protein [Chloroflexota bacterium]
MDAGEPRILPDRDLQSDNPGICPFLRSVSRGAFRKPYEEARTSNRCIAGGPSEPQPLDWQRVACLTSAHVRCPRYLHGSEGQAIPLIVNDLRGRRAGATAPAFVAPAGVTIADAKAVPRDGGSPVDELPSRGDDAPRGARLLTPVVSLSLALLVLTAAAAISFVAATGGLQLPTSPPAAGAVASNGPSVEPSIEPTASPLATPQITADPTTAPTRTPTPTATPVPEPTATPAPTSDRYAVLTPCPSKPDCYLYTIKQYDNLQRIARYFGIPYETVLAMNPWIRDPSTIHPGDVLELPPPTR